ncbi:MAG: MBL fold metallo-hydrolase [Deltaproteobacteria bacterium]
MSVVYAAVPELPLRKKPGGRSSFTTVLMGAWMNVVRDEGMWLLVSAFGETGWVPRKEVTTENRYLKIFFIDVGQGDGCLIETPGRRVLVDGGQYRRNMYNYLTKYKYRWLIERGERVRLDAVIVSHFDADHFGGLNYIIGSEHFEIGHVLHNGIARFSKGRSGRYDSKIGRTVSLNGRGRTRIEPSFSTVDDAKALLSAGGLMRTFETFLKAVIGANSAGRLQGMRRLAASDGCVPGFGMRSELPIEVLGPVAAPRSNGAFPWFKDESHTSNGNSVVLRLWYGDRSFLLGGDLNTPAQEHLLAHWEAHSFQVDVAKACHHGASEFTTSFLEATQPYATVFSSGDNENYAHPRADALGCCGRYSRGRRPLVFSTELARSHRGAARIHYGLINCRSDGERVVMAQMLEKAKSGDMWDQYELPMDG